MSTFCRQYPTKTVRSGHSFYQERGQVLLTSGRLSERISFRATPELYSLVKTEAEKEAISLGEQTRRIVEQHYAKQVAATGIPEIERALRRILEPYIDSLASLTAHAGVAAGTSAWIAQALATQLLEYEPVELWTQAVLKSKENVRRLTMEAEGEDE